MNARSLALTEPIRHESTTPSYTCSNAPFFNVDLGRRVAVFTELIHTRFLSLNKSVGFLTETFQSQVGGSGLYLTSGLSTSELSLGFILSRMISGASVLFAFVFALTANVYFGSCDPQFILGGAFVALAIIVFTGKDALSSLIALICLMGLASANFLAGKLEFFAFVFMIVYVGAVAILFLFVIMLLNFRDVILDFLKHS